MFYKVVYKYYHRPPSQPPFFGRLRASSEGNERSLKAKSNSSGLYANSKNKKKEKKKKDLRIASKLGGNSTNFFSSKNEVSNEFRLEMSDDAGFSVSLLEISLLTLPARSVLVELGKNALARAFALDVVMSIYEQLEMKYEIAEYIKKGDRKKISPFSNCSKCARVGVGTFLHVAIADLASFACCAARSKSGNAVSIFGNTANDCANQ